MADETVHSDTVVVKDTGTNRRRVILDATAPRISVVTPGAILEGDIGTTITDATAQTHIEPAVIVLSKDVFGPTDPGQTRLESGFLRLSRGSSSDELEVQPERLLVRRDPGPVSTLRAGNLDMGDASGRQTIEIDAEEGRLRMGVSGITVALDARSANLTVGGGGEDGDLLLLNGAGRLTIGLNGATGNAVLGGGGQDGDVRLLAPGGEETVRLDGQRGRGTFGGGGTEGAVRIRASGGATRVVIDGAPVTDWPLADGEGPVSTLDLVGELRSLKEMILDLEARVTALEP